MTSGYSVSRKASFPWISPLTSLRPPTTSLLRLGVEVLLVPRSSAHPQTWCIFTPPDFLPPLPRGSPIEFFNPAIPTGIFSQCSLHMWPHMTSQRQSQLRRQLAHSQFSAVATIIINRERGHWQRRVCRQSAVYANKRNPSWRIVHCALLVQSFEFNFSP